MLVSVFIVEQFMDVIAGLLLKSSDVISQPVVLISCSFLLPLKSMDVSFGLFRQSNLVRLVKYFSPVRSDTPKPFNPVPKKVVASIVSFDNTCVLSDMESTKCLNLASGKLVSLISTWAMPCAGIKSTMPITMARTRATRRFLSRNKLFTCFLNSKTFINNLPPIETN